MDARYPRKRRFGSSVAVTRSWPCSLIGLSWPAVNRSSSLDGRLGPRSKLGSAYNPLPEELSSGAGFFVRRRFVIPRTARELGLGKLKQTLSRSALNSGVKWNMARAKRRSATERKSPAKSESSSPDAASRAVIQGSNAGGFEASSPLAKRWRLLASIFIIGQLWAILGRPIEFATQGPTGTSPAAAAF